LISISQKKRIIFLTFRTFAKHCQDTDYQMMFADKIKQLRDENQMPQRQIAAALEIDTATYCKIEKGDRRAKREQVLLLSELLKYNYKDLLKLWLADQVYEMVKNENEAEEVLNLVHESIIEYGKR
jgi:transcriptional regulator with XRE-family HTH domain